jgi:STE24 endopeptidase
MNTIAAIVLTSLVLEFALHLMADGLNLKASQQEMPEPLKGFTTRALPKGPSVSARANLLGMVLRGCFSRGHVEFGWLEDSASTTGFAFRPGAGNGRPDHIGVTRTAAFHPVCAVSAYAIFGIENRFGFNTTGWRTFVLTASRSPALLSLTLGGPVLAVVLWLFEHVDLFHGCMAGSGFRFMFGMQWVTPRWILLV